MNKLIKWFYIIYNIKLSNIMFCKKIMRSQKKIWKILEIQLFLILFIGTIHISHVSKIS